MSVIDDDPVFETTDENEAVALIRRAIDVINSAKPMFASSSVRIEPAEVLDLLEAAVERLPEELRTARWLLKERKEFLDKVTREGDEIVEEARNRAERLVSRQEIVRAAKSQSAKVIDEAEAESRRMRREAEDWCDQHLARFEIVLEKTSKTVKAGRDRLTKVASDVSAPTGLGGLSGPLTDDATDDTASRFFDQDL
jgi:F0F1-type ATP synthase membrane subunit b/b'